MKPGGQRIKGHSFERRIANDLKRFFPDAKRGFQTRGGGKEQADIIGTPFHFECKHHKKVDMKAAWEQACSDASWRETEGVDNHPVVVAKSNRGPVRVLMAAATLGWLLGHVTKEYLSEPVLDGQPCIPVEFSWEDFEKVLTYKYGEAKKEEC